MSDDLVKRLRTWADEDVRETARDGTFEPHDIEVWAALMEQAADRIEALEAEVGRRRSELADWMATAMANVKVAARIEEDNHDCERCETCRYWEPIGETKGFCHQRPPAPFLGELGGITTIWPVTWPKDWCGEYEPKEE